MRSKNKIIIFVLSFFILFVIDRFFWMPERAKQSWNWERGILLGEPLSYKNDFEIRGSEIVIKKYVEIDGFININRKKTRSYYFAGCYFGRLYIYDEIKKIMTIYTVE